MAEIARCYHEKLQTEDITPESEITREEDMKVALDAIEGIILSTDAMAKFLTTDDVGLAPSSVIIEPKGTRS